MANGLPTRLDACNELCDERHAAKHECSRAHVAIQIVYSPRSPTEIRALTAKPTTVPAALFASA